MARELSLRAIVAVFFLLSCFHNSSFPSVPNDCAIVATEAYHRVAPAASWARLLHIDYQDGAHMICAWQLRANDPVLVYDIFFLSGATLELPTARRDAEVIAKLFADELNRGNWTHSTIKITGAHFVELH
jgi:hypothetical protein